MAKLGVIQEVSHSQYDTVNVTKSTVGYHNGYHNIAEAYLEKRSVFGKIEAYVVK